MKILALADTHLGAGAQHRQDALADQEAILDQVADLAIDNRVDLILHGGDVFHRTSPSPKELHVFRRFARRLAHAEIPMIAIHGNGNHEAATDQRSAIELFDDRWLRVSRRPETITEFAGVTVCTLPAVSIARLVAHQGGGDRAQITERAVDLLLTAAHELFDDAPADRSRILLAHWAVSGASLPSGLPVDALDEPVLPLEVLESIGYDAMVFGHIHRCQLLAHELEDQSTALYTGSPGCWDFGEATCDHGVWIIDTGDDYQGVGQAEFVPLNDRRFVTISADLTVPFEREEAQVDETDVIASAIAEQLPLTDAVVRVTYKASEEQHRRVDVAALEGFLQEAGVHRLYGGIQWDPVRTSRARVEGMDDTLDPLAAVDLWLQANEIDDAPGRALRDLAADWLVAA